jgi:type VI secretion system secreted protein VgrG
MTTIDQQNRPLILSTALGENRLAARRLTANEGLSELFDFRIDAVSDEADLDFGGALGQTVSLKMTGVGERFFNGVLAEARWVGVTGDLHSYQLSVKPWLWLLTCAADCRVFSSQAVPDIIQKVFKDRGFSDFRPELNGSYPPLEYCVQYRESDFAFVSRLMEQNGIYYYFEHTPDQKHTLVLADGRSSHRPIAGLESLPYNPVTGGQRNLQEQIESWRRGRLVRTGRYVLNDYNYRKPNADLLSDRDLPGHYARDSMEVFDYLGEYLDPEEGRRLATVRIEATQSLDERRAATGSAYQLFPGAVVALKDHPQSSENKEYLVVRCTHSTDEQSYRSQDAVNAGRPYLGGYELTPLDRPFRAPLVTPRAVVLGVQSALVVARKDMEGEEIDVDSTGHIWVRFYWDRVGMKEKKPSCRLRIAQTWAGNARGAWFLPRVGDEVLVQYEEGDPDRPIVIGSVYNGHNEIDMSLPDQKTVTGFKTQSTKNSNGYNMIAFIDKAGAEKLRIRAQKELMFKALGDETRVIGGSQSESVGGDETITVGATFDLTAKDKISLTVGGSNITMDPGSITLSVGGTSIKLTAASVETTAPKITDNAAATMTINSAMLMVNAAATTINGAVSIPVALTVNAFSSAVPPL